MLPQRSHPTWKPSLPQGNADTNRDIRRETAWQPDIMAGWVPCEGHCLGRA